MAAAGAEDRFPGESTIEYGIGAFLPDGSGRMAMHGICLPDLM
ncbi:MAG: hypothetical protein ABI790_09775 [Betaproteobacteria bacterium]